MDLGYTRREFYFIKNQVKEQTADKTAFGKQKSDFIMKQNSAKKLWKDNHYAT